MARKISRVTTEAEAGDLIADGEIAKRGRTLVFISHDSRDADLAEAFANLLSDVSAGTLKSFRSSDKKGSSGIEFGTEWYKAIMSQLGDATDVVALLTQHSTNRPWILYEAGVAKGKLDTNVLGIALGVPLEKVSTGPFGQFQNCGDDEDSLTKLVIQLLQRNPDASPREEAIRMQVRVFLSGIKELLAAKGKTMTSSGTDETSIAKLFEEVKVMVRELPERVDDRVRSVTKRVPLKRMRRFHPMMFEDLFFHSSLSETRRGQATTWLLIISILREDFPWIYEVGLELYHALRRGNPKEISIAQKELIAIVELTSRGPFSREFISSGDEDAYFVLKSLPEMVERFLERSSIYSRSNTSRTKLIEEDDLKPG